MKNLRSLLLLCLMGILLVACANEDEIYLSRVDVLAVKDEAMEEENMIIDLVTLDSIKSLLGEIRWEPNSDHEIEGSEDFIATLFYTDNEDQHDQLYLYRMSFNSDGSLSIVSNNEEEGYGILDEEYAEKLKTLLEGYIY
ncbi:hypothetical protein [Ureibacillus aquaedulcis]|uniref:Lipoprotein n=1 Tax=Ureibacillus aquaedulcis TaxID=3058421 RepID=A0ABT8GPW0_9BACL|nr:hypothetical protein [Ureibacillus sp. BA0131]MDN4493461.1 hypothetical protein [Ureibacillus sp. BA0131]